MIEGRSEPGLGVFGRPNVTWLPEVSGGYRKKTMLPLIVMRHLLPNPPKPNTQITRTDITPAIVYVVEHVDTQAPLIWTFSLSNFTA